VKTSQTTDTELPKSAWGRFWFQPTDPGTLGFMRIMTGLIVIYVHLAYIFDFQTFFGANGYWNINEANDERRNSPVSVSPMNYGPPAEYTITTPGVLDRRVAAFDFLKHLPETKAERDQALAFMYFVLDNGSSERPFQAEHFRQSLVALQNAASLLAEDREKVVQVLSDPNYNGKGLAISLPGYMVDMPPAERLRVWRDIQKLLEVMPAPRDNFNAILAWWEDLSAGERQHLGKFLRNLEEGEAGKERIAYIEKWREDPKLTYAKGRYLFSLWYHVTNPTAMWVFHFIFIGIFVMFTIGLFTRVTSVLAWMAVLFYIHRTQQVLFGMDTMMNVLLFYLMISPCGSAFSIDRLIARYRASKALMRANGQSVPWAEATLAGSRPSIMANFAVRLFQIHFCFIYAASGLAKLKGTTWWDTTAAWSTIANPEFCPFHLPFYESLLYQIASIRPLLAGFLMVSVYFTLFLEMSLPFLIWTRLRPIVLIGAIFLHTGIAWIMGLTCFGLLMMTLLLCYVPASVIRERIGWAPGSGPRIAVRFNARERRHARIVSLLRAFDLTGQLQLQDDRNAMGDPAVLVTTDDDQTLPNYDGFVHGLRTLQFGRCVAWVLYVPGVAMLLRSLMSGSGNGPMAAPSVIAKVKTPSAR